MTQGLNFNINPTLDAESLLKSLDTQRANILKLQEMQQVQQNSPVHAIPKPAPQIQLQYPVECVSKELFNEFLQVEYGISEDEFFAEYKLYLDAKQEIEQEKINDKKEKMKAKIKGGKSKKPVAEANNDVSDAKAPRGGKKDVSN